MDKPISLCMIVKNEAASLPRCLASVSGLVDEVVIIDTGSSDDTAGVAREWGAKVFPFDFSRIDFAAARNYALEQAAGHWILVLDADETLDRESLPELKTLAGGGQEAGYYLERINHSSDATRRFTDYAVRLFSNRPEHRYAGRVHETVDQSILAAGGKLSKSGVRIHHDFLPAPEARQAKNHLYLEILKQEIVENPSDTSRLDFLASEYHQLGMFPEATRVAEHLAHIRPLDPQAHLFAGVYNLLYLQDFARSRDYPVRSLALRPDYPEAQYFYHLADTLRQPATILPEDLATQSGSRL